MGGCTHSSTLLPMVLGGNWSTLSDAARTGLPLFFTVFSAERAAFTSLASLALDDLRNCAAVHVLTCTCSAALLPILTPLPLGCDSTILSWVELNSAANIMSGRLIPFLSTGLLCCFLSVLSTRSVELVLPSMWDLALWRECTLEP